jgi:hypothetical protein
VSAGDRCVGTTVTCPMGPLPRFGATASRWSRVAAVVALLALAALPALLAAGPVAGQTGDDASAVDADEAEGEGVLSADDAEVRRIVVLLAVVAAVALLLTGLFWYHTIPSRRVIAARRERARAAGQGPAVSDGDDLS